MTDTLRVRVGRVEPLAGPDRYPARARGESVPATEFDTLHEATEATLALVGAARRELVLFSRDLDPVLFSQPAVVEAFKQFAIAGRGGVVRVILLDPAAVQGQGNPLLTLAQRLATTPTPRVDPAAPSGQTPPYLKPPRTGRAKKRGARSGHAGHRRPKPARIDRREEHTLAACPNCQGAVTPCAASRTRIVEDIPDDIRPVVTEHTIRRYWCGVCHKHVEPTVPDALPGSQIGLRVGVLSNTVWPRAWHEEFFRRDGVLDLIHGDVYTSEIPWTKPSPNAFGAAMEAVGVTDPAACVYVGDRLFDDVWGAQNAGMRAIHIPLSTIPATQVGHTEGTPDATVTSLAEIPDVVRALGSR